MAKSGRGPSADPELSAINVILEALSGLEGESIQRVLDYVFGRLSIARSAGAVVRPNMATGAVSASEPTASATARRQSIRDLKEEKRPQSANQMAALVAYYLSEIEGTSDSITASDLQKYFKQGGFKLPKSIPQALPNAAAAGYFDAIGEGRYRLNPVGYNLVVHNLPRDENSVVPKRSRKRTSKSKKQR